jgi:hypothetical protein
VPSFIIDIDEVQQPWKASQGLFVSMITASDIGDADHPSQMKSATQQLT